MRNPKGLPCRLRVSLPDRNAWPEAVGAPVGEGSQPVWEQIFVEVRERGVAGHKDQRNEVLATFEAGTYRWGELRPL